MTITVSFGITDEALTISSGDPLVVLAGGTVEVVTILSGGSATLSSGALAGAVTVEKGGTLLGGSLLVGYDEVFGLISGATFSNEGDGAYLSIESGGTARGVTLSGFSGASAILGIQSGGATTGTVVAGYGLEIVGYGGAASGDTVLNSGSLILEHGGTASAVTVLSGGTYSDGGTVSGDLDVASGPVTSTTVLGGVTVSSGGAFTLFGATVLSGAMVSLGTATEAESLTVSKGAVVLGPGSLLGQDDVAGAVSGVWLDEAELTILSGGTASGVSGDEASAIRIDLGGSAAGTVIVDGAEILDYGSAADTMEGDGGLTRVFSAGVTSGDIVSSGGKELVSAGGVASGTQVLSGGTLYVLASGKASGTVVSSGGKELVSSGGAASGTQVLTDGLLYVLASGATTGTVVSSGGKELLSSGGTAVETAVLSGGSEYVYSGSLDNHGTVSSGGAEAIYAGGTAGDLTLLSGGRLTDNGQVRVAGAGTLAGDIAGSGAIVELGGGDLLLSGGGAAFAGSAVISGGTIELGKSGQLGTGAVIFVSPASGSAVLQIDAGDAPAAGGTFANVISNFSGANDDIDLRSIAFVAGASATVVGSTLTLSDGGKTYKFTLAGTIAGAYPVLSDGHGGTLIDPTAGAPKAIEPKVVAFAHAAAAFAPPDAAKTALVSSTSPAGHTPFLHATASAGAGRL